MTDRRRETRQSAAGIVELQIEAPQPRTIVGTLVDISNAGFRVRHHDLSLATGNIVRFSHSSGAGAAVVVWTRVFEGSVESGLYIQRAA